MSYISYVTNYDSDSVSIIHSAMSSSLQHTVGPYVTVGNYPWGVAITTDKKYVYVTNSLSNTVSVIATSNYRLFKTIPVGKYPQTITIQGRYAYLINFQDANISVIDTVKHEVTKTIEVEVKSFGIAITPDGKSAYITSSPDTVFLIDLTTDKITHSFNMGKDSSPGVITITADGKYACISLAAKNQVATMELSTNTIKTTDPLVYNPQGMAITSDSQYVYVANRNSDKISLIEISSNSILQTITVGNWPLGVSITSDGKYVYVTNPGSNTVSMIDTGSNAIVATINVPTSVGIASQ